MTDDRVMGLLYAFDDSVGAGMAALRRNPDLLHARTSLGETPLHFLCVENRLDALRELVHSGAAVDTVNDLGTTPLSDAASLGYAELVEFLLASGASLRLEGQVDPVLHGAVRGGHIKVVEQLLAAGSLVNEQDDLWATPLHLAVEDDRVEIASLLLAHGADPSIRRIFDETALDVARESGSELCVALLSPRH